MGDIEFLRRKFEAENSICFIGCHSGKFPNEMSTDQVRSAVMRHCVSYPVLNDAQMQLWKGYERKSWPSYVLISPKSQKPILILNGEGMKRILDLFISVAYDFYYESLNHQKTFKLRLELVNQVRQKKNGENSGLRFPGKIICIEKQEGIE